METLCQKPSPAGATLEAPAVCLESSPAGHTLESPSAARLSEPAERQWLTRLVFVLYAGLLALTIYRHEPWADEAQAWLMARDLSLFDLFVRYLRYEGSPGLWHLLLMVPAKLGLPYCSMSILAGVIAAGGVFLFLTHSRIPLVPRLLLPFSYFLVYQYAVVARSYVLMPLLLFAIATLYRDRARRIALFTLLLCLLANANVHGMLVAVSLVLLYVPEAWRQWGAMEATCRRRHVAALAVFGTVLCLLVLQLLPPSDSAFAPGIYRNGLGRLLFEGKVFLPDSLTFGGVPWVSLPVVAVSLVWFWRHKALGEYLLPVTGLLLFFALKHVAPWHQGVLFLLWVLAVWIGCERQSLGISRGGASLRLLDKLFPVVVIFVAGVQIWWSVLTIRFDLRASYSGSHAAATYIKAHNLQSKTIFLTDYHAMAILPYFQDNIFANLNDGRKPAFWWWSTSNPLVRDKAWPAGNVYETVKEIKRRLPDVVVAGLTGPKERVVIPLPDYARTADCDGLLYWKGAPFEASTFLILCRKDGEPPAGQAGSVPPNVSEPASPTQ